tara:strand:- start:1653 stop:2759 length:1107 start_codon:yes stop_codon:yes gene_type:complete
MKVGYIVGVFDLFHSGHEHLINRGLQNVDKLIVGIHTDVFVASYKRQPKQSEEVRKATMQQKFPELTVETINDNHIDLIKRYNIQYIFHGDDWEEESYKKQIRYYVDGMDKLGVEVVMFPYSKGISTTDLINNGKKQIFSHYLFDLDKTLILNKKAMPFATELVAKLKSQKKKISVITNNNRYSPDEISSHLKCAGIDIPASGIYSSLRSVASHLHANHSQRKIFVWGTESAKSWLIENGILVSNDSAIVVVLYRNNWNYSDLVQLCNTVKVCEEYIIGNVDFLYPDVQDTLPDTGAIAQLIQTTTGKTPDIICGKSSGKMTDEYFVDAVLIGDSLQTDAVFAEKNEIPFLHIGGEYSHLGVVLDLHT